jgi:lipopolysaccharide/colanic/teichoic acid biosynthesis glycosyltransferase
VNPRSLKRVADVAGAALGLALLSPLLVITATAIRISLGRPVFFRQRRPGLGGKPFVVVKFRTMKSAPGADSDRLGRVGKLIRSFSLDELPQLWNVLKGDMSLVGPRPLMMQYLDRYTPRQARRHEIKPGITGWTAVNGRNALSWEEKFELDVWYVDNWSIALDVKILVRTMKIVLLRSGVSNAGHATMPEFHGS